MKNKWRQWMAALCYAFAVLSSMYVGGWIMFVKPIRLLLYSYRTNALELHIVINCIIKIALASTVSGLVWCLGYMACNYFKGTEDEYDRLMEKERQEKLLRREERKRQQNMQQEEANQTTKNI